MKSLLFALLAALLFGPALAHENTKPGPSHPSVWKVQGKAGTVYLFGSIHLLAPNVAWRDQRVEDLIHGADTFVFETALDSSAIAVLIAAQGTLPAGQSLRALLPPPSQKDLDDDVASVGVAEAGLDSRRPWLATLGLTALKMSRSGMSTPTGPDMELMHEAQSRGKPIRYFETLEQQMALLVPNDPKLELESFEAFLKDFRGQNMDMAPMVEAWRTGDDENLEALLMKSVGEHPAARKALFDDRNKAWIATLKDMLDNGSRTYFVTVGAGQLLGK